MQNSDMNIFLSRSKKDELNKLDLLFEELKCDEVH